MKFYTWARKWPVFREITDFGHKIIVHYKIDESARLMAGDYRQSPRLRFWGSTLLIIALVFLAAALIFELYYNPDIARPLHLPLPVDAAQARMMDLTQVSGGGGVVQQSAVVNMSSWITAEVKNVPVVLGDIVTEGDTVLYECDARPFESALKAAEAQFSMEQDAVTIAQKQRDAYQDMVKTGLASNQDVLVADSNLATAKSKAATAEQTLVDAQRDLKNTKVVSPVTGIVLTRQLNPAERITNGQQVMQLGNLSSVYFLANVSEDLVSSVQLGATAEVSVESFPGMTFKGTVFFIDPNTDARTRAFTPYIKIPNPDLKLKPGMSGFARITLTKHVLAVPESALVNAVGQVAHVFVITPDNRAELRTVSYGAITQGYAEIIDHLKEGEIVATGGVLYLRDGDKVHYSLAVPPKS